MDHTRVLTASVMSVCAGLLAIVSCTRTTDRVLEPVGGGDASTTAPDVGDASLAPIGPVARPRPTLPEDEPAQDFRLARSPELGLGIRDDVRLADALIIKADNGLPGQGGAAGTAGMAGTAGAPRARPAATGGGSEF